MNILSLFDGISCGQLALLRAGIKVDKYYASEIDKYAIQVTQHNFPNTIQLGDVTKIDFKQFEGKIDLLIGGSPCTNLSIAGNRKGLEGEESRLFWEYVRALKEVKPKYFLLENVESMSNKDKEIISKELGCYPICINSSLLSAQNRKRYYWFNWGNMQYDLFGFPTCDIPQPKDKGILLQDILESGIAHTEKSYCLTTRYQGAVFPHDFHRKQRSMVAEPIGLGILCKDSIQPLTKARTLTSYYSTGQTLEHTLAKNIHTMVCQPVQIGHISNTNSQANRVYSVKGKSISLVANGGGGGGKTGLYKIDLPDGDYIIRKLTPIECERLQTLPDNYTSVVSNTQRYKSIGNGWTVDVIAYIFGFLKQREVKNDRTNN